jgi:hypothetical protein
MEPFDIRHRPGPRRDVPGIRSLHNITRQKADDFANAKCHYHRYLTVA